ncbi:MAG: hypothetical protein Q4E55_07130 [Bacteroidales bacterium]|nr:hypothetical protein [Bacteroidales bacterium]
MSRTATATHLFPFARLCVRQSIWQLAKSVLSPWLHAQGMNTDSL